MADGFAVGIDGLGQLERVLKGTPVTVQQKVLKGSARDAVRPVVQAARANVQRLELTHSTGLLAKSIGVAVRMPKTGKNAGTIYAAVGPRNGYKSLVIRDGQQEYADPVRYAHLLEFGHAIVRNGRVVGHAKPRPWLRPAWESTKDSMVGRYITRSAKRTELAITKEARRQGMPK